MSIRAIRVRASASELDRFVKGAEGRILPPRLLFRYGCRMADSTADPAASAMPATRARHVVLAFALAITAISYLDRVCISMTAPFMQKDLGLSDAEMGLAEPPQE